MHRLEPVIWKKGTFLNPQYLQAQDRYLEELLRFNSEALEFRPWGFRNLRIDQEALTAGSFGLTEGSGILPDGLLFDFPRSDVAPPSRPLLSHFDQDQEWLDVYLAVPQYRSRGFNVASGSGDANTRFRAEIEMVRDEAARQSEKPVLVARKNFRFLVEGENRDNSVAMRVARVRKTKSGLFQLDPRIIPPLLEINASDSLVSIARRLVELLTAKSTSLAGMRRQRNQTLADFTAADIPNFWLLYTVNSWFAVFRHIFETKGGHPEALFSAMLSLAGALTTFSLNIHPRDLPRYDHDDLGSCFIDLDEKLRLLLDTVIPSNFVSLPLKLVQPSIYAASIDRDDYLKNTRMYLAIRARTGKTELLRAPQLVKISSIDSIDHLVQRALPGVPLIHTDEPPSVIPVKLEYEYFSLSQSGGPWESIVRARNLAAYVPGDFPEPQMEIIILLPHKL